MALLPLPREVGTLRAGRTERKAAWRGPGEAGRPPGHGRHSQGEGGGRPSGEVLDGSARHGGRVRPLAGEASAAQPASSLASPGVTPTDVRPNFISAPGF